MNWAVALILPHIDGRTRPPVTATIPRSPITAISRKMMTNAAHTDTRSMAISPSSAPVTSSLSAVVSRNAPSTDSCFQRRARYPSKKSVSGGDPEQHGGDDEVASRCRRRRR